MDRLGTEEAETQREAQVKLCLPDDVMAWVNAAAEQNFRSKTRRSS